MIRLVMSSDSYLSQRSKDLKMIGNKVIDAFSHSLQKEWPLYSCNYRVYG